MPGGDDQKIKEGQYGQENGKTAAQRRRLLYMESGEQQGGSHEGSKGLYRLLSAEIRSV